MPTKTASEVLEATDELAAAVARLRFAPPVVFVYNPLSYAAAPHRAYVERFARRQKRVVFLGMNPGPFGMAQTGVPFGEIAAVRDWMGIEAPVEKPRKEHPKRPITGFDCPRSEVSGSRLWGLFQETFGDASAFFEDHYVANYCPLVFLEETGRNRTPDKLQKAERDRLSRVCDRHLVRLVDALRPRFLVGVGKFAEDKARSVFDDEEQARRDLKLGSMLHPSPASPKANRGWAPQAKADLERLGVW